MNLDICWSEMNEMLLSASTDGAFVNSNVLYFKYYEYSRVKYISVAYHCFGMISIS